VPCLGIGALLSIHGLKGNKSLRKANHGLYGLSGQSRPKKGLNQRPSLNLRNGPSPIRAEGGNVLNVINLAQHANLRWVLLLPDGGVLLVLIGGILPNVACLDAVWSCL
jgi:hypothetical protein